MRRLRSLARASALLSALLAPLVTVPSIGCVIGYRGAVEVEGDFPLTDVDAVRVALPDTPIAVLGQPLATSLHIDGVWTSVGGSKRSAADNASAPALNFAREGRFGALTAVIPLQSADVVDLEVGSITMPDDRDLEIWTGVGDVEVAQMHGNISIDVDAGRVTVFGGDGGVGIDTGAGDLEIETTGNLDAHTGRGRIVVRQDGVGGNDVIVSTKRGDIEVTLRSDANLDLKIDAVGDIRVQTRTVSTVTAGSFAREVGNGTVKIWLTTDAGSVTVRLDESL
ncbi:MAG: DUF4097 family beta strand repeat-containing protein [Nannocystaceae bacterium]